MLHLMPLWMIRSKNSILSYAISNVNTRSSSRCRGDRSWCVACFVSFTIQNTWSIYLRKRKICVCFSSSWCSLIANVMLARMGVLGVPIASPLCCKNIFPSNCTQHIGDVVSQDLWCKTLQYHQDATRWNGGTCAQVTFYGRALDEIGSDTPREQVPKIPYGPPSRKGGQAGFRGPWWRACPIIDDRCCKKGQSRVPRQQKLKRGARVHDARACQLRTPHFIETRVREAIKPRNTEFPDAFARFEDNVFKPTCDGEDETTAVKQVAKTFEEIANVVKFELSKRTQDIKKTEEDKTVKAQAEADADTTTPEPLQRECNTFMSFLAKQKTQSKQSTHSKQVVNRKLKPKSKGTVKTPKSKGQGMRKTPPANHPKQKPKVKRPHPNAKTKSSGKKPQVEERGNDLELIFRSGNSSDEHLLPHPPF